MTLIADRWQEKVPLKSNTKHNRCCGSQETSLVSTLKRSCWALRILFGYLVASFPNSQTDCNKHQSICQDASNRPTSFMTDFPTDLHLVDVTLLLLWVPDLQTVHTEWFVINAMSSNRERGGWMCFACKWRNPWPRINCRSRHWRPIIKTSEFSWASLYEISIKSTSKSHTTSHHSPRENIKGVHLTGTHLNELFERELNPSSTSSMVSFYSTIYRQGNKHYPMAWLITN